MTSVVINCRFLTQPITGVQRFAEEITRRIVNELAEVELVAPRGTLRHHELGGVSVQQIGRMSGHLWEQVELAHYVKERRAKLLSLANTGPIAVRRQLVVIHDLTWLRFPESYSSSFRVLYSALTPLLIRRVQAVCTVSEFSKNEIADRYKLPRNTVNVIPNAVDESLARVPGTRPQSFLQGEYFLVVSSINRHKNVGRLVEIYSGWAAEKNSDTALVLVGGGSSAFKNREVWQSSRIENVVTLGRVSDDELVWLYRNARAFIFPSLYEGFGIPPLEAQALGCPVAASNAASLPEVLQESVEYFDPNDSSSIARALDRLCDTVYLDALKQRGSRNVQRYNWDESARNVARVLGTVE